MIDWFIKDWFPNSTLAYTQAKNLVGCALICAVMTPILIFIYLYSHKPYGALGIFVAGSIMSMTPFFLKASGKLTFARQIFIIILYGMVVCLTYSMGGISAPSIYWLSLVPILAVLVGSIQMGVAWAIIVTLTASIIYIDTSYYAFGSIKDSMFLQFISVPAFVAVIIALIIVFEINKRRGFSQLEHALEIIEKMKDFQIARATNEMQKQLVHQATHDILTDLPNRALLFDRLQESIAQAKHTKTSFALFFLDIDHFKHINDSFGHIIGDSLLKNMAQRLKSCLRETDTVARIGGDEFILIINMMNNASDVNSIAKKILAVTTAPFHIASHELLVTVSFGISLYPRDGTDYDSLIKSSDTAMFYAKDQGRSNYQLYTSTMDIQVTERLSLESDLRRALERDEFVVYYQPILDLASWKIVSVEALLRWNHPTRGLLSPNSFISLAEKTNLIVPIGEYVLRTACKQINKWQNANSSAVSIAINLSGIQLKQKDFVETVAAILYETNTPANYLELELTESILMNDITDILTKFNTLKNMGIKLVIDDFGTGYSSLNYLKNFPVNKIKIDQSFLQDIHLESSSNAAITLAVIGLAKILNLTVVAEGVETNYQLDFLRTHLCNQVQGNYFCAATTADAISSLLQAQDQVIVET